MRAEPWQAWDAPPGVHAVTTLRSPVGLGSSLGPYQRFNLATHVGDMPAHVVANRAALRGHLPAEPRWMAQVHGTQVIDWDDQDAHVSAQADAAVSTQPGVVCAVLTADCLPILLADRDARAVAAIHAGWRGLAAGVIEATLAHWPVAPERTHVWLGPAISQSAYEVGEAVRTAFVVNQGGAEAAFRPSRPGHWWCDLYLLARQRLSRHGFDNVAGGQHCTHREVDRFYSHRRDGVTGRMASLVWIQP